MYYVQSQGLLVFDVGSGDGGEEVGHGCRLLLLASTGYLYMRRGEERVVCTLEEERRGEEEEREGINNKRKRRKRKKRTEKD